MHKITANKKLIGICRCAVLFFTTLLVLCLYGCASKSSEQVAEDAVENLDSHCYLYFMNREATKLDRQEYSPKASQEDSAAGVEEYLEALGREPEDTTLVSLLGTRTKLVSYNITDTQLMLDFDDTYQALNRNEEVLFRASLVRTLCQVPGIDSVGIYVENEPIADSSGTPYGNMSADMFIDNIGTEINAYDRTEITLYFADAKGTALVPTKETVAYSTNVAIEKIIMEKLIEGPKDPDLRATLSPDRKVNSVVVKDGTCYVDLTEPVVDFTGYVDESVSLYSIVDSLTELNNVNKVNISIDGDTDRTFRGGMRLDATYGRNLDIIGGDEN